jgi:putative membrane protein
MKFIVKIIISSLAVMLTTYILPGVQIDDYFTALLVALVLVFLNVFLKPLLVLFTLPATVLTFGLFLLVINAFIIWIADRMVDGFSVKSFWWAVLFSIVLSLITSFFESLDRPKTIGRRNDEF